jgi:hypothetical protein
MVAWTIGIEIGGARADGEGLLNLLDVFERDVPNFMADRAFLSGRLVVCGTVESESATKAFISALATISDAFDAAGIDENLTSEVMSVTLHRAGENVSTESDWLPPALLRRIRRELADAQEIRADRAGLRAAAG